MEYTLSQSSELSVLLDKLGSLAARVICNTSVSIPPTVVNVTPAQIDISGIISKMDDFQDQIEQRSWDTLTSKLDEIKNQMSQRDGYDYAMLAATFAGAGGSIAGSWTSTGKSGGKGVSTSGFPEAIKSITKLGDLFKNIGTGWMGKKNQEVDVAEEDTKTPGGDSLGFASSFGAMGAGGGSLVELIGLLGKSMSGLGTQVTDLFTKWDLGTKLAMVGTKALQLGMTVLGSPITWIVIAIAALAALVIANWDSIKVVLEQAWEFIKELGAGLWEGTVNLLSNLWISIVTMAQQLLDWLKIIFITIPLWIWDNILLPIINGVAQWVTNMVTCVTDFLSGVSATLSGIPQWIKDKILTPIINHFKGCVNFLVGLVEGFANIGIKAVNTLIKALNKIHFEIPDWVPGIGGKSFGVSLDYMSTITLPRLARGAVIPPSSQFLAILGDQTSGRNLEAPEGLIRQILREELGTKSGQAAPMQVEVYLDGKQITASVERHQRQRGATLIKGGYSYGY